MLKTIERAKQLIINAAPKIHVKREIEFVLYNAKERLNMCMDSKHIDVNRIPKTYLASYLGIAPPSLSRLLREIKD